MCAIGRAMMSQPEMILLDEPSMGLAPQVVEEIFEIVRDLNASEKVSFLLAEQNANIALRYATSAIFWKTAASCSTARRARCATTRTSRNSISASPAPTPLVPRRQTLPAPQAVAGVSRAPLPLREKMSAKPTDEGRSRERDGSVTHRRIQPLSRRPYRAIICRRPKAVRSHLAPLDLPSSPSLRSGPSPARGGVLAWNLRMTAQPRPDDAEKFATLRERLAAGPAFAGARPPARGRRYRLAARAAPTWRAAAHAQIRPASDAARGAALWRHRRDGAGPLQTAVRLARADLRGAGFGADPWGAAPALRAAGFRAGDIVLNCFSYHLTPGGPSWRAARMRSAAR